MSLGGGVNLFTCLRVVDFFCICMVRGGGDILFQALNIGGRGVGQKKKWEGWIFFGSRTGLHCFQTLNGGGRFLFMPH